MGLVEGVAGEVQDLVIDAVGHVLGYAAGHGALDAAALVAVDEGHALGVDDLVLLFRHGAADHVRLAQGEAREAAEDLDDLLLVDDAAVGDLQDRAQQLMLVLDALRVGGALDEAGDGVHGAGAVERDDGRDVFDVFRAQLRADTGDARALQLEDALGAALGQHFKGGGVVLRDGLHPETGLLFAHKLGRVLQHRQVPKAQKVHLEKPQLLQRGHRVLADHRLVVLRQGHVFIHRLFGDDHAGGVGGGVAGHALQRAGHVDEAL